jgi:hypothetical protein
MVSNLFLKHKAATNGRGFVLDIFSPFRGLLFWFALE